MCDVEKSVGGFIVAKINDGSKKFNYASLTVLRIAWALLFKAWEIILLSRQDLSLYFSFKPTLNGFSPGEVQPQRVVSHINGKRV